MTSRNEHTGDRLQTKPATDNYRENYDKIFNRLSSLRYQYEQETLMCVNPPTFDEWLKERGHST